jgi:DNA-binding FadR family transcriptional regulator
MPTVKLSSEFLDYLAKHASPENGPAFGAPNGSQAGASESERLPSLSELGKELGISVATLREQLEVAKAIGLVDVRPRTGIRRLPYTFLPAVRQSLSYAVAVDWGNFMAFSDLRNHVESVYWEEAVRRLASEDHDKLRALLAQAWEKLNGRPVHIPHAEHRQLHLCIYSKLENPFVQGLLEAYWEIYEAVGLNMFADYNYLQQVWRYHQQMVDSICSGDFDSGYQALVKHKDLLFHRPGVEGDGEI